ncbi:MAG: 50S ribosomal protein L10 [Candidatus Bathyarchaeota archaeon]|nr:50S ribosomal protein L10 [Candidatus Bathyarchaeota archaeon]MDH5732892.1 50S ribosomal protein L10 [Candidatus Bathyarchaeota archaeon]
MSRQIALEKTQKVEEVKNLLQKYRAVGVAGLEKVRGAQLQELKRKLENDAYLRVIKNTLIRRAIAQCNEKPELERLVEHLSGSNIYLFTDLNPFKLVLLLDKSRVMATARAGDIAVEDVVVSAGNTGLPPGPIISLLGGVGLRTRIEAGSVWVSRDALVAKKGDVIDTRLAGVLSKLGIKAVEIELSLKAMYDDGLIMTEDQLQLDLEETQRKLGEAYLSALNLSINAACPLPENIVLLLRKARQEAYSLALSEAIPNSETIVDLIRKAHVEVSSLHMRLKKSD